VNEFHGRYQYLFLESICTDEKILEQNYRQVKSRGVEVAGCVVCRVYIPYQRDSSHVWHKMFAKEPHEASHRTGRWQKSTVLVCHHVMGRLPHNLTCPYTCRYKMKYSPDYKGMNEEQVGGKEAAAVAVAAVRGVHEGSTKRRGCLVPHLCHQLGSCKLCHH
jgi:hypothetical protein